MRTDHALARLLMEAARAGFSASILLMPVSSSMQQESAPRIAAVIVTYQPDMACLQSRIEAIVPQVWRLYLLANAGCAGCCERFEQRYPTLVCEELPTNLGLAEAQNLGTNAARQAGATHLLLLDQDSMPAPDMVECQLAALARSGNPLTVAAPAVLDARRDARPLAFFRCGRWRLQTLRCREMHEILAVDTAIASGLLIPVAALKHVGLMRAALFIDLVDIDWCLRARGAGVPIIAVCAARLAHQLGDPPRRVLGRAFTYHPPHRGYYFFRNALWLCRHTGSPMVWKWAILGQLMRRLLLYPLLFRPHGAHLRMMLLGLWHGLRGRLGPL
jgi:rhamnosyltransferase